MTMPRALVPAAFAAVLLRQFDAVAFDLIHRADMDTIGPDNFHTFLIDDLPTTVCVEPSSGHAQLRPLRGVLDGAVGHWGSTDSRPELPAAVRALRSQG